MRVTIAFDQAKADATMQGAMPDGSGVGVNYVDVIAKASKLTLPDGRKLLLKRKGLKLTLAIGDKQGEALLRRLDHGPDVREHPAQGARSGCARGRRASELRARRRAPGPRLIGARRSRSRTPRLRRLGLGYGATAIVP